MDSPLADARHLEAAVCPLCGSSDSEPSAYLKLPFRVVRCCDCRLWYLNPRVREEVMTRQYLSDGYYSDDAAGYVDYAAQEKSLAAGFRALLAELHRRGLTGGRLLEVGSGYGYFLREARDYFDECVGIEMSRKAAEAAAQHGATVYPRLDDVPAATSFDFVFASHVIEHVYDPVPFTRRLLDRLKPQGVLFYSAPDMGSLWRKAMGRRWPSFKYPEHVSFYDADSLQLLLQKAGGVRPRRIASLDRFLLGDVCAKMNVPAPDLFKRLVIPLPATSICVYAQAPGASEDSQ